ncbi:ribosome maturation protein SBDS [Pelomyxa schiedti]|nr:ribosome maturation protein SBDS [Pelomyxa schiedti]
MKGSRGSIKTPQNQKLLTNVAVVRLNKAGVRFEIACYPNTVLAWRSGVVTDLSEVLQMQTIFTNVSKGVLANKKDLTAAFKTTDESKVAIEILKKGELQVTEKERTVHLDSLFRDIATVVAEKCVDPHTKHPLTVGLVERAMHDIHYSVNSRHSAKQQALEVIKLLKDGGVIPIERAPMRLRLTCGATTDVEALKGELVPLLTLVTHEERTPTLTMEFTIDPSQFRAVDKVTRTHGATLRFVEVGATSQGDTQIE